MTFYMMLTAFTSYILGLMTTIEELYAYIAKLQATISELQELLKVFQGQINKDSHNSSKPPSTDGYKKVTKTRKKTDKSQGGQKGHAGHTLELVDKPDYTLTYLACQCEKCSASLENVQVDSFERRQVFDIPPIKMEVTEHKAGITICPHCGELNKAAFPNDVQHSIQYGPQLKATCIYLSQYQLVPYKRLQQLCKDLFDLNISQGTLYNFNRECYERLEDADKALKELVISSSVVHFDETGIRINGKTQWLHVACTDKLTFYAVDHQRGYDAMVRINILPQFKGIAVHDFWRSYFKFNNCYHALCNAHHQRELIGICENDEQVWSQDMIDLLLEIKKTVEEMKVAHNQLDPGQIKYFEEKYDRIIIKGLDEIPTLLVEAKPGKKGKKKQSKAKNLIDRLDKYRRLALTFMYDFRVSYDNNQGERDLRMAKIQQKISGNFRSKLGADISFRIRGNISTARKNGISAITVVRGALMSRPYIPEI